MSKYTPEIVKAITDLIEQDSFTIAEICEKVGISQSIYYEWQDTKSEFLENIKRAEKKYLNKIKANARKSLNKLVEGYEYEEKSTTFIDDGAGKPKIKETKTVKKHIPPNAVSVIFALKNTNPEDFKDRQEVDLTSGGKKLVFGLQIDPEDQE